jgi:hypothetical protein
MDTARFREGTVTEHVDGIPYTSTKLPATKGINVLARVIQVTGETGLQLLIKSQVGDLMNAAMALPSATASALVRVAAGLSEDPGLMRDILGPVKCGALRIGGDAKVEGVLADHFDSHFAGEYLHLAKVLAFVLGHNFLGFTLGFLSTSGSPSTKTDPETSAA